MLESGNLGTLKSKNHRISESWSPGILESESQNLRSIESEKLGVLQSWNQNLRTLESWNHRIVES